jgi:hypothetical protein
MTKIDWNAIAQFRAARCERFVYGILTEADRRFFEKADNAARTVSAGHRTFNVRPSIASDHYVFACAGLAVGAYVTIADRSGRTFVVRKDTDWFGEVTNSDQYALLRIQALADDRLMQEHRARAAM